MRSHLKELALAALKAWLAHERADLEEKEGNAATARIEDAIRRLSDFSSF